MIYHEQSRKHAAAGEGDMHLMELCTLPSSDHPTSKSTMSVNRVWMGDAERGMATNEARIASCVIDWKGEP